MHKRPRVGILVGSLEQGGAQSMALRLLDGLEKSGIDVYLLSIDRTHEVPIHGNSERAQELAERIHFLSLANVRWSTGIKVLISPWQWVRLNWTVHSLQLDIVLSFMERANILNLLSLGAQRRILSIRKHLDMALSAKTPAKRWLIKTLYPWLLCRSDRINFNSLWAAKNFQSLFQVPEKKISVIHNYVDHQLLQEMAHVDIPCEYTGVFDHPVIITCGRLIQAKGHKHLVRAFAPVHEQYPQMHLVILGDGPLRKRLQLLTQELGLVSSVHFPGYQPNPFAWMARASFFVLPSLAEGFPNVLLEGMSLGLPVISTDCPSGPREILDVQDQFHFENSEFSKTAYGLLTPRLDQEATDAISSLSLAEQALAQAMLTMCADQEMRFEYGRAARQRAQDFTYAQHMHAWMGLFEEVI